MRESYLLWTGWLSIFIFWLYVLLAEVTTVDVYDKNFDENRWTCWGFYSLHFLAHEDFFTVLSRTALLFTNFCWQCCILASIYGTIGGQYSASIIIWAAIIALFGSMPLDYILGYFFLSKIYESTLHKYDVQKKIKSIFNKKEGV